MSYRIHTKVRGMYIKSEWNFQTPKQNPSTNNLTNNSGRIEITNLIYNPSIFRLNNSQWYEIISDEVFLFFQLF